MAGLLAVQVPHAPFAEIASLPEWDAAYAEAYERDRDWFEEGGLLYLAEATGGRAFLDGAAYSALERVVDTVASSEPQPHDIAGDDEQSEQRIRSVASMFARLREELSAEDWTIVKLRILNDQPWSTVAAIIGRTPGAARKHYTTRLKPKLSEVLSGIEIGD